MVLTPVVTEILMKASEKEHQKILDALQKHFFVKELDLLAAKFAAEIWNIKKRSKVIEELTKAGASFRTKIKIDTLIIGIAKAQKVDLLYTEDEPLKKMAEGSVLTASMPKIAIQAMLPFGPVSDTTSSSGPQRPSVR